MVFMGDINMSSDKTLTDKLVNVLLDGAEMAGELAEGQFKTIANLTRQVYSETIDRYYPSENE